MTEMYADLTDEEILNPEENSYEAALLIATLLALYEQDSTETDVVGYKADVTNSALLRVVPHKLREIWKDHGLPAPGTGYAAERGVRYIEAVANEVSEAADPAFVREAFASNITDPDLQQCMIALLVALANSSGGMDESEHHIINEVSVHWNITGLREEDSEEDGAWLTEKMLKYDLGNALHKSNVELKEIKAAHPKGSGSCFVATAVLENNEHPALDVLRSFRDEYLLSWSLGRTFVDWYYQKGPKLAAWLEGRPFLRATIKSLIILPLARILTAFELG